MTGGPSSDLKLLKRRLIEARAVVVLTGAGISADSGVPTFRGADGLWRTHRAEELATPEAFERDPRLVWEWYNWRRELIAAIRPNDAHYALVELEKRRERFWLITQNVDGLHREAGSRKLSEIHGNIWMVRCTQCGRVEEDRSVPIKILPSCAGCAGLLRPHIVWFGESLDPTDMARCHDVLRSCDALLIIGTSGVVYPAAGFAAIAKQAGAFVGEINPDETPQTDLADVSLRGRAKDVVPLLLSDG
ncbi:SIR2 family NAD-dependent protein deacylase [Candidatus Nitrospira inopinata]|jgi:NAD-dependent deacetylase|uniref:NAD-dependent protein deacylase n=1 Tax=Candidatus Nitrospira inopinata TaxID=1715989 RepID=A0A0S4KWD1_9BACT|nr:NAD-dependent deacylase [Candidatus Nitrospira inopinata]CUQ67696.1 NAD-dependent protein deacylase [Candidatus Nitrospira inopinata]